MAFPTIATTNSSNQATNSTTHTVNLPASIASGDLLLMFFAVNEAPTVTTPTGWTLLTTYNDVAGATCLVKVFYKTATGSEGASVSVTIGTARQGGHATYRISTGTWSGTPEASTNATSGSGQPDPPSLTPSGGAKDYLWFAIGVCQNSATITTAPTNYTTNALFKNATFVSLGVGTRQLNASSEDPGAFVNGSGRWGAGTVSITPTASAASSKFALLGVG